MERISDVFQPRRMDSVAQDKRAGEALFCDLLVMMPLRYPTHSLLRGEGGKGTKQSFRKRPDTCISGKAERGKK